MPLLAGRDFQPSDKIDSEPVVIINRALADRYFGDQDPLGRRVAFDREVGPNSHWMTIVGVVGNVRRESLALDEKPSFYAPILQDTTGSAHLLLRTKANPLSFVSAVRDRLAVVDPGLPLADISTLERQTYEATGQQ